MVRGLLLLLVTTGVLGRPDATIKDEEESRLFDPDLIYPSYGQNYDVQYTCQQEGDMFYQRAGLDCMICACFTSVLDGSLYPKCAYCNRCPAIIPEAPVFPVAPPGPLPLPAEPIPTPDYGLDYIPEPLPIIPSFSPECPPPIVIPGPPRPYPVPVPVPGKRILVPVPVPVPSPPEKIIVPGHSVPVAVPVEKRVPYPVAVNRPYTISSPPQYVQVPYPVPEFIPGPERDVPVPAPSSPIEVPMRINNYIPIPVMVNEPNIYPVSTINYLAPICRYYLPLRPFRLPGDRCRVHICRIKYNYVYVESHADEHCFDNTVIPSLLGSSGSLVSGTTVANTGGKNYAGLSNSMANAQTSDFGGWAGADAVVNAVNGGMKGWGNIEAQASSNSFGGLEGWAGSDVLAQAHNNGLSNFGGLSGLVGWSNFDGLTHGQIGTYGDVGGWSGADASAPAHGTTNGLGDVGGWSGSDAFTQAHVRNMGGLSSPFEVYGGRANPEALAQSKSNLIGGLGWGHSSTNPFLLRDGNPEERKKRSLSDSFVHLNDYS